MREPPVVYVNRLKRNSASGSARERIATKPTEAEWGHARRWIGDDGGLKRLMRVICEFRPAYVPWRDNVIDDGFAETAPIGSYPKGSSPFGIDDLAGNVFEWCLDGFEPYRGKERTNPRGPAEAPKRVYRGGSWKSRVGSLRTTARAFNLPDYSTNDVGFRVICECEPA